MEDEPTVQQTNLEVVGRAGALIADGFAAGGGDVFAADAVFHFANAHLPDLDGDHRGVDAIAGLFRRLASGSEVGFSVHPVSITPHGDELVVTCVTNTVGFPGVAIEVDAVVVWRVVEGRIQEVWDIPATSTAREITDPVGSV